MLSVLVNVRKTIHRGTSRPVIHAGAVEDDAEVRCLLLILHVQNPPDWPGVGAKLMLNSHTLLSFRLSGLAIRISSGFRVLEFEIQV
jgi:hypothetical protein